MSSPEALYEMLKARDAEIAGLRSVIDDLIQELAEMYADAQRDEAYDRAADALRDVYGRYGFKSDGRMRG